MDYIFPCLIGTLVIPTIIGEVCILYEKYYTKHPKDKASYSSHSSNVYKSPVSGREICYKTHGDINSSKKIVYLHGLLGSRLEYWGKERSIEESDSFVITIDRPGHGFSTHHTNRTYLDFSNDIVELIDHLNIKEFSVIGWSSGAWYIYIY